MADTSHLIMFYGTECSHCHEMEPIVKELEEKEELSVRRLETWHNAENAAMLQKYDQDFCGGVPFFFNEKTKKRICGSCDYEKLKTWALGN